MWTERRAMRTKSMLAKGCQTFGVARFTLRRLTMTPPLRADRTGAHRQAYMKNKKTILASQDTCGICGQPVDKSLRPPHQMSPTVDHIIPITKGGHPSDMTNLQLAHWMCNRQKSDKLFKNREDKAPAVVGNRILPQSRDWLTYKA